LDLLPLIQRALSFGMLTRREAGILRALNVDANAAKHQVTFFSRL